jgi:hypothetical protein
MNCYKTGTKVIIKFIIAKKNIIFFCATLPLPYRTYDDKLYHISLSYRIYDDK